MTKKNYFLKRTTGIYCITHTESGKQYCGQSVDCFERFKQHTTPRKGAAGIKGAIMKYGVDAFSFVILEECKKEELNERECFWIAELNSLSPNGYNLTSGGDAPTTVSEETRVKLSQALKGNQHSKGKTLSEETRAKRSAAMMGKTSPNKGKTRSPEANAASVEGRRRKAARAEAAAYAEPLLEALQSLRTDKQYVAMDSGSTPLSATPVPPPTLEELDELLKEL